MRTLLIGLLVGGISGFAIQKYVLSDPFDAPRHYRADRPPEETAPVERVGSSVDVEALLARIRELEAQLPAEPKAEREHFGRIEVPTTEEGIDLLFEEFQASDDLDRLLALIRALLLQGEEGYPKLTKLLLRVVGKGIAGRFKQEQLLEKVVPALKLAMRHEKELVGYVGYLLTEKNIPGMMRTGAMAAAMFLSVNRVSGSEKFAPLLLEAFTQQGAGMGRDQARMLVTAMGILKQREAVDPLLAMLNDPEKRDVHRQAIEALGQIGDPRVVGTLVERLRQQDRQNQWSVPELRALAAIGTPEAVAAAEQYLANSTNDDMFFYQVGDYLREQSSPKIVGLIRDRFRKNPGSNNMWSVVRGLSRAPSPEAATLLEEIATTSTQEWIQSQARRSLDERKKLAASVAESER